MFAISVGGQRRAMGTALDCRTDGVTELWEIVQVKYAILVLWRGLTCPLPLSAASSSILILLKFPRPTKSLLSAPHCQEVEDGGSSVRPEGT